MTSLQFKEGSCGAMAPRWGQGPAPWEGSPTAGEALPTLPSGGSGGAGPGAGGRGCEAGQGGAGLAAEAGLCQGGRELPAWQLRHLPPARERRQHSRAQHLGYVRQLKDIKELFTLNY